MSNILFIKKPLIPSNTALKTALHTERVNINELTECKNHVKLLAKIVKAESIRFCFMNAVHTRSVMLEITPFGKENTHGGPIPD